MSLDPHKSIFSMRLILLILLLTATCVSAGFFGDLGDKVKKIFSGEESVSEKITSGIKKVRSYQSFSTVGKTMCFKILNTPSFMKIREKLSKLKNKVKKTLELSPRMLASLKERIAVRDYSYCCGGVLLHDAYSRIISEIKTHQTRASERDGRFH